MAAPRDVDLVTGKTFTSPAPSNSQITPYSHQYPDSGTSDNQPKLKNSRSWNFSDAEFKRRRRVAAYKAYTVEGTVKNSIRKTLRWFKNKYLEMRYGWW